MSDTGTKKPYAGSIALGSLPWSVSHVDRGAFVTRMAAALVVDGAGCGFASSLGCNGSRKVEWGRVAAPSSRCYSAKGGATLQERVGQSGQGQPAAT